MKCSFLILLVTVLLFSNCSNKSNVPSDIIQPDEMGNMLFEVTMAEEFVNGYVAKDSSRNKEVEILKEYQKIYLLHGVSEKKFRDSYDFYKSHPYIFKTMMDSLDARAQKKRNEMYQMGGA